MSMTVVVTRDVAPRFRGFLSSCMLEIAPGVYTSPRMTRGVRERVWEVVSSWYYQIGGGSLVMTWRDSGSPGGQTVLTLGTPVKELIVHDGLHLVRGELPDKEKTDGVKEPESEIDPETNLNQRPSDGSLKTE